MRSNMLRILLAAAVLAAVATISPFGPLGSRPAVAGGPAPWCAVVDIGGEMASYCHFWRFEDCVPHVLGGNRGACQPNPAFKGPIPGLDRPYSRHRGWR